MGLGGAGSAASGNNGAAGAGEGVVRLPSHRRRAEAFGIDVAVVVVVFGLAIVLDKLTGLSTLGLSAVAVVGWIYYVGVTAWLMENQTAGKIICGLRIHPLRAGFDPRSPWGVLWSVGRHTVGYVVVDVFLLGALLALVDRRRRCLHDYGFASKVTQVVFEAARPRSFAARYRSYWEEFAERYEELTKRNRWFFFPWKWLSKALIVVALLLDKMPGWSQAEGATPAAPAEEAKALSGKAAGGLWGTSVVATGVIIAVAWPADAIANLNVVGNHGTVGAPATQEIFLMRADGTNLRELTHNDSADTDPDLFADRRVVFTSERDGNSEIYVMNADGSDQTRLTSDGGRDFCPAWSPDGDRIAFTSDRDGATNVYVMNADGSNQQRVTPDATPGSCPDWSPDADRLVFVSDRDGKAEIYTMRVDGTEPRRVTHDPAKDYQPAWSPDGNRIAFTSDRDGDVNIYLVDADGGAETRVTDNPSNEWHPRWVPDGDRLIFYSNRGFSASSGSRASESYVTDLDGSGQTRLTSFNDCGPDTSTCRRD